MNWWEVALLNGRIKNPFVWLRSKRGGWKPYVPPEMYKIYEYEKRTGVADALNSLPFRGELGDW